MKPRSPRMSPTDRYLNELLDFGGEAATRAEIIADMQRQGTPQGLIDRWLQGQEFAAQLARRRAQVTTRVVLKPTEPRPGKLRQE